jgi:hypothetical protein
LSCLFRPHRGQGARCGWSMPVDHLGIASLMRRLGCRGQKLGRGTEYHGSDGTCKGSGWWICVFA